MPLSPDDPRHGTWAGAQAHYRLGEQPCDACKIGKLRYAKATQLRALREGPLEVDPEPMRPIVRYWNERGVSMASIAHAAGVAPDSVKRVMSDRQVKVRLTTLRKVLAVTEQDLSDDGFVYAALTRYRVASLMADGQKLQDIVSQVGLPMQGNWRENPRLKIRVARAVRDLYQRSPGYGPHKGTATRARNQGAVPSSGWWDPGTLAEPADWVPEIYEANKAVRYDEAAVWRRMHGDMTVTMHREESEEVVRRLAAQGLTLAEIERRTGLQAWRYRYVLIDKEGAA